MMKKRKIPKFKRKYFILLILISIYIITRLFFLFSVNLFNEDECKVGTITKELVIGPSFPIFDYPPFLSSQHYPGILLEGLLAIPFYMLFGESGISVKLMFLTISAGIVCLLYLFLDKFFNRKAAIIAAMLMIFSIPVYTLSTMSQGGPHIESVFFDILIMFLFYRIFFDKKQDIKSFIFFGLASGFAMFINLSSLVMIFTCFLFWFIFNKRFFLRKNFFIFIISFFIGLGPWVYYNLTHNFIGLNYRGFGDSFLLKVFGNELSINRIIQIIIKFKNLIVYDLPKSFMFKDVSFFTTNFFSYAYFFLFLCSFIFLLYYCRKSIKRLISGFILTERFNIKSEKIKKETFILIYPIIFILIYCISSFSVSYRFGADGYRYLLTFYVFMFIIISLFLTKLWNKKTKHILIFLIIILFLLGLIGNLSFVSFKDIGKGIVYRPYCYDQLGPSYGGQQCNNLNKNYQPLCYAGNGVFVKCKPVTEETAIIKHCRDMDKKFKCFCYIGLGRFFYLHYHNNITYIILQCDKLDKNYRPCCYKGIGWEYGDEWANAPAMIPQLCSKVNEYYKPYCFEGLGQGMSQFIGVIPSQAIRQCNKIDKEYRPYCFKGLAWSLAEKFGDNPTGASKFAKYVDEEYRGYFYNGIGSYVGLMFSYNITRASEECGKLGENNIYCTQGLHNYINKTQYN